MELKNKKVTVVGLGVSGRPAAIFLNQIGADVYVTDGSASPEIEKAAAELRQKGIKVETGKHSEDFFKDASLIVVSPGVHDDSFPVKTAKKYSIPVITEIELAARFCRAQIVAVTGTSGKSTTVTLISQMLNDSGKKAVLCGNIGDAFTGYIASMGAGDTAVVEASSFQLKRIDTFRPKISAIINIDQNHFDWHPDFKDYFDCKKNIYKNQDESDFIVLNHDDRNLRALAGEVPSTLYFYSMAGKVKGAYYTGGKIVIDTGKKPVEICSADEMKLIGSHNISNVLCASLCAYLAGAAPEGIRKTLFSFTGLKHRFQDAGTVGGVRFIDDSKATTVGSCKAALLSCDAKAVLIAGGRDKGSDFKAIKEMVAAGVRALVLIGEARDKIRKDLDGACPIYEADSMDDAVSKSFGLAQKGDIVLLSPMCASFDMFTSYKHRGDVFCEAVRKLKQKISV